MVSADGGQEVPVGTERHVEHAAGDEGVTDLLMGCRIPEPPVRATGDQCLSIGAERDRLHIDNAVGEGAELLVSTHIPQLNGMLPKNNDVVTSVVAVSDSGNGFPVGTERDT